MLGDAYFKSVSPNAYITIDAAPAPSLVGVSSSFSSYADLAIATSTHVAPSPTTIPPHEPCNAPTPDPRPSRTMPPPRFPYPIPIVVRSST
jgi:hypothetical protein